MSFPEGAIARAKFRGLVRAWRANWFAATVLAPMIVGGFYFVLEPSLERAAGWLRDAAPGRGPGDWAAAGLLLVFALIAAGLPGAVRRVYALGSPDEWLDALPVAAGARFRVVAVEQILWNVPAGAALAALLNLASGGAGLAGARWAALAGALAALAFAQLAAAMALVRLDWLRAARLVPLGAGALGLCALAARSPEALWAAGPLAAPAAAVGAVWAAALGGIAPAGTAATVWAGVAASAALALAAGLLYRRFRDADVERARAAASRPSRSWSGAARWLDRRLGREVGAQVARDVRLTLRADSPSVLTAGAAATLFALAGVAGAAERWVAEPWLGPLLLLFTALGSLSLAALAPLLLERHGPAMWVERSSGVSPAAMLKARKYFALVVSSPALVAAWVAASLLPAGALDFAARATLGWVSVATIVGAMAFDIAAAPAVGLLLAGLFAVGVCGMYALRDLWPIGLFLYAYSMHALNERAEAAAARLGEQG